MSYYFWGNAIGVILAFKYFYFSVWRKNKGTRKRLQWRNIQMFVSAWVGAFVLNHLLNLCFPAVSPRIYLAENYQNELKGLWILASMRNAITNAAANTFSAFPSGHCGLSLLAVLLAFRIHLSKFYTYAVAVSTFLIILATQVLRYHYFVDFFFSSSVVLFGAWLGGFHDGELYQECLQLNGLEDTDEEGKNLFMLENERGEGEDGRPAYEAVPLMDMNGGGGGEGGGASSPMMASPKGNGKGKGSSKANDAAGADEEMGGAHTDDESGVRRDGTIGGGSGRQSPSMLSAAVFSISRALSSQKMNAALKSDDAV